MNTINLYNIFLDEWSKKWFQFILDNSDKPWNYYWLSLNPNITWDIVKNNLDNPWNYNYLSCNKMDKVKECFIRKKHQEWFQKSKLKEELIANLWHPKNYEKFKYYDPDMFRDEEFNECNDKNCNN